MQYRLITSIAFAITFSFLWVISHAVWAQTSAEKHFDIEKDLLLANYDCRTDVDDLYSAAALYTLLANPAFSRIDFHAVAGAYGVQGGSYVPPNELFQLAFNDSWSDAHEDFDRAIGEVSKKAEATLSKQGDVWIAEAGQSDFSAALVRKLKAELPNVNLSDRLHIVQHSDWNEEKTSPDSLRLVKQDTDYIRIRDGNVVGNGTPGFRAPEFTDWEDHLSNPGLKNVWRLAADLANRYNGKDGRYNNQTIAAGGLDFSDTVEVCRILGLENIKDAEEFFQRFGG